MNRHSLKTCGIFLLGNNFAYDFAVTEIVKPFVVCECDREVIIKTFGQFAAVLAVEIINDESPVFDSVKHIIVEPAVMVGIELPLNDAHNFHVENGNVYSEEQVSEEMKRLYNL